MNGLPWHFIFSVLAWTTLGTFMLLVARILTKYKGNPASRHLIWNLAFVGTWILPLALTAGFASGVNLGIGDLRTFGASWAGECGLGAVGQSRDTQLSRLVLCAWLAGAAWNVARAFVALTRLKEWHAHSSPYELAPDFVAPREVQNALGNVEVRLALRDQPLVPSTWGTRRAVILLPRQALGWSRTRFIAVLCHELAHVQRHDNLIQLLVLLTCAVHWFNPVFWFCARSMEEEAEFAADEWAISQGLKPSEYATELLLLASQVSRTRSPLVFGGTSILKRPGVEHRIRAIIEPGSDRGGIRQRVAFGVAGVFAVMLFVIAGIIPRLLEQANPPAPIPMASCPATASP